MTGASLDEGSAVKVNVLACSVRCLEPKRKFCGLDCVSGDSLYHCYDPQSELEISRSV